MKPAVVDFETFGIEERPHYPPVPVGVSIKLPGKPSRYYAWGHREGNTCTYGEAKKQLEKAWKTKDGVLFHNASFDLAVAKTHFELDFPATIHDTMVLLFLDNPHRRSFELKKVCDEDFQLAPDEQDAVREWLLQHQPVPGVTISKAPKGKNPAGAYIAWVPPSVVGPYAEGDTDRTWLLFQTLYPSIQQRKMGAAYDREMKLMACLLDMEQQGVAVDVPRLKADIAMYDAVDAQLRKWVYKKIGKIINIDSGKELVAALLEKDLLKTWEMGVTPKKGDLKTDMANLQAGLKDAQLAAVLRYLSQLGTCLNTFMKPWLRVAEKSGGKIFTTWHQTRGDGFGARTGRLSSSPNFQNIPKEFKAIFLHEQKGLPKAPFAVPALPKVRSYVIPFEGDVLIGRDFHSQELRVLAHFIEGALLEAYKEDPWLDVHEWARQTVNRLRNSNYDRKPIKNLGFSVLYGAGLPKIAAQLQCTIQEAKQLLATYLSVFPGLKELYNDMRLRAARNEPFQTWGGREVYCEPPAIIDGRIKKFDYKMPNYLIQGSSADVTKEAVVAFYATKQPQWKLTLQVHDELVVSAPAMEYEAAMNCLRLAMLSPKLDVPMLSDGKWSSANWGSMVDYEEERKLAA